jgi:hypothetical protein
MYVLHTSGRAPTRSSSPPPTEWVDDLGWFWSSAPSNNRSDPREPWFEPDTVRVIGDGFSGHGVHQIWAADGVVGLRTPYGKTVESCAWDERRGRRGAEESTVGWGSRWAWCERDSSTGASSAPCHHLDASELGGGAWSLREALGKER